VGFRTPGLWPGNPSRGASFHRLVLRSLVTTSWVLCGACAIVLLSGWVPILQALDRQVSEAVGLLGTALFAAAAVVLSSFLHGRPRFVGADEAVRERLEATLGALPDLFFDLDREGRIRDFRAPRPELLYRPPEEFLGRRMRDVLPPEVSRVVADALEQAAVSGHHSGSVYSLDLPSGKHWFELSVSATG
jgi:PAS domain-containing protein